MEVVTVGPMGFGEVWKDYLERVRISSELPHKGCDIASWAPCRPHSGLCHSPLYKSSDLILTCLESRTTDIQDLLNQAVELPPRDPFLFFFVGGRGLSPGQLQFAFNSWATAQLAALSLYFKFRPNHSFSKIQLSLRIQLFASIVCHLHPKLLYLQTATDDLASPSQWLDCFFFSLACGPRKGHHKHNRHMLGFKPIHSHS